MSFRYLSHGIGDRCGAIRTDVCETVGNLIGKQVRRRCRHQDGIYLLNLRPFIMHHVRDFSWAISLTAVPLTTGKVNIIGVTSSELVKVIVLYRRYP